MKRTLFVELLKNILAMYTDQSEDTWLETQLELALVPSVLASAV